MITNTRKLLLIFASLLFLSVQVFSKTFIDVNEFNFPHETKKGIRVCVFNTKTQKYVSIDYFPYPSSTIDRSQDGPLSKPYYGATIYYDGNITVPSTFNPDADGYVVRTGVATGSITFGTKKEGQILKPDPAIQPGSYILEELNKFISPTLGPSFPAYFFKKGEAKPVATVFFAQLSQDKKDNRDERGKIGELATEYTMIGYGYNKLPSQNSRNHGLDGVFTDGSDEPELFLTETKCDGNVETTYSGTAAKKIQKDFLNETIIAKRLGGIPEDYLDTRYIVEDFIADNPDKIFKFAHRIKPNGEGQCIVTRFDKSAYTHATLSASNNHWVIILKSEEFFFKTEEDYIKGFVKSISPEGITFLKTIY